MMLALTIRRAEAYSSLAAREASTQQLTHRRTSGHGSYWGCFQPEHRLERAYLNFLFLFSRAHETRSKLLQGQPVKV